MLRTREGFAVPPDRPRPGVSILPTNKNETGIRSVARQSRVVIGRTDATGQADPPVDRTTR